MWNVAFFIQLLLLTNVIVCCWTNETKNNDKEVFEDLVKQFRNRLHLVSHADITVIAKSVNDHLNPFVQQQLKFHDLKANKVYNNDDCAADLVYTLEHIKSKWAVEMIDADGKLQSGILRGNIMWMGDFRECSEVEVVSKSNQSLHNFHGEYCIAQWNVKMPAESVDAPVKSAVCLPDSCNGTVIQSDIENLLQYMDQLPFIKKYGSALTLKSLTCKSHEKLDNLAISFLLLVAFFCLLIISGSLITIYAFFKPQPMSERNVNEFVNPYRRESISSSEHEPMPNETIYNIDDSEEIIFRDGTESEQSRFKKILSHLNVCPGPGCVNAMKKVLLCFCIFTNGQKILTTEVSEEELLCIHGIRVLSMIWIILGHTYVHCVVVVRNIVDAIQDIDNIPFQVIMHGTFSVDSFFLLSGFLVTYLFMKETKKRHCKINWPYLFIHRYWRLTPVYAVVIFYVAAMFKYTGSGGFWDDADQYEECKTYWWWNLLYINNFLSINSMCIAWSWYLANDMQFYIIAIILLYVIWRWPKPGIAIIAVLLVSSWSFTLYISDKNNIPPLFTDFGLETNYTSYSEKLFHHWDLTYSKPYCRIGPYLIGVLCAYVYHRTGKRKQFLTWWQQMLGWTLATFCSLSVVYGLYHIKTANQVLFDFYNAFSRSSFSLGVAWVIYCCLTGHAVVVNRILSCRLWIPLSRLTYCAYLIHPVIMSWYLQNLQQPLYFTHQTVVMYFLAFLFVSYGISLIISLAFEAPMMNLEKSIRQKFSR